MRCSEHDRNRGLSPRRDPEWRITRTWRRETADDTGKSRSRNGAKGVTQAIEPDTASRHAAGHDFVMPRASRSLLDHLFISFVGVRRDLAGVFQAADDVDDLLLHRFDFGQADRAQVLHFLAAASGRPAATCCRGSSP